MRRLRSRKVRLIMPGLFVAIVVAACGGFVVGTANPNNCKMVLNKNDQLQHPHESRTNPGEVSGTVKVQCTTAPAAHQVTMRMFRSPVGQQDWTDIGGGTQTFGPSTNLTVTMHPYHIKCPSPAAEFDYAWAAQHRYKVDPTGPYELWSVIRDSNTVTINCGS